MKDTKCLQNSITLKEAIVAKVAVDTVLMAITKRQIQGLKLKDSA